MNANEINARRAANEFTNAPTHRVNTVDKHGNESSAPAWGLDMAESIAANKRATFPNDKTEIVATGATEYATEINAPEFSELSHATTSAICPLDFDTVFDAYNYAMEHRLDENPLAVAIPTDAHGTDYGRSLALNGVKLFAVWSDELEETANGYVYTTEAGAREAMAQVEENDKEAGVYEPDYWKVSDMTKYFA